MGLEEVVGEGIQVWEGGKVCCKVADHSVEGEGSKGEALVHGTWVTGPANH